MSSPGIKRKNFTDTARAATAPAPATEVATGKESLPYWTLRAAVLIGGASVMVIEILGSRVLAPVFGTTLHVWSALITVTLAALAVGYAIGGRLADRRPGSGPLMTVMAVAGVALLLADLITKPVLQMAYAVGMIGGTFISATLLFLPALLLLGMVSPMAVRAAADHERLGRSVGNLYALSTVGSVVGSLAVSLLLIPNVGVHTAMAATAIALGVVPLFHLATGTKRHLAALFFIIFALAVTWARVAGAEADGEVMYKNEIHRVTERVPSAYGDLVVTDHQGTRYLFLNGVQQGSLRDGLSGAMYIYGLQRLATLRGIPKSVLIWGLGPGMLARALAEAGSQVTVIEIDPASERVARKYFGLPDSVKVIIGDARTETLRLREKYDVIIVDVFNGDTPPFHLVTREAFESLRERMAPQGLIAINFVGGTRGKEARAASSVIATLDAVIGHSQVFAPNKFLLAPDRADFVSTLFLVAGDLPETPAPFTLKIPEAMRRYMDSFWTSRLTLPREEAIIFTDNYAPLEAWSDAAVRAMRY
ncbi:MAG TPA: fused MFS/spermidine synthase [Blastocatellia bacterium]|nr:fused MFS/spermidine synthase [Blastocatellia bacterium]